MKRMLIGLILAVVYILANAQGVRIAQAQTDGMGCDGNRDTITYEAGMQGGGDIGIEVSGSKDWPAQPIVIGQDESHTGVTISVMIKALKGTAKYWRLQQEDYADNPVPRGRQTPAGYTCYPISGDMRRCYKNVCNEMPDEEVYRNINPDSVSVWLDPSAETEQFLGWGPNAAGLYPLRYLFPEKWALGAWTPTGWEQADIGDWYPTGEEVWAFGQTNPWFTYLFPDPNETDLPGQHLLRMSQPLYGTGYVGRRVLGLYGAFYSYQNPYASVQGVDTGPRQCLVDNNSITDSEGSCPNTPDGHNFGNDVIEINIYFSKIPLDLPGKWRIGIKATQFPAKYDHGKTEVIDNPMYLSIGPSAYGWDSPSYDLENDMYGFDSYVIVSTPCYATDPKSCMN